MNTRSKRASSVGVLLGFCVLAPVAPDATLNQGDRQHIAWSYSGILAAGAAAGPAATADVVVWVRPETSTVQLGPDATTISVRPNVSTIQVQPDSSIQVGRDVGEVDI